MGVKRTFVILFKFNKGNLDILLNGIIVIIKLKMVGVRAN